MSKSEVKNFLVYNLPDEDVNIDIIIKAQQRGYLKSLSFLCCVLFYELHY